MKKSKNSNAFGSTIDGIYLESVRRGPVVTFLIMAFLSAGLGYIIYYYFIEDSITSNREYRLQVAKKENENKKTETMLAGEPQFKAEFKKVADLYNEAKPLLPEETEVSNVLSQVEVTAQRNNVKLTGLQADKQSVKSPVADKLYEREIPAEVTGTYPQIVNFFADISRMPRILLVRDYTVTSQKNLVSAKFTLVAYHAPPPAEMREIPKDLVLNQGNEQK